MDNKDIIKDSYNKLAKKYDTILSVKKIWGKICCKIIWGFRDTEYANELLTWLPNDFSGKLLDIPTGTALFTVEKYKQIKDANIVCMDFSQNMLQTAEEKFKQNGLNNIVCRQGDIGNLPFDDNTFDMIISMNGFHAFPDKEKAFNEITRVLKSNGIFIGCYYIKEENKRTDWFINNFYVPKNYFTPPFQSLNEVKNKLEKMYNIEIIKTLGSIVYFKCKKDNKNSPNCT
jgi:ubiquinone/menaquinone biosynthesis C-methylase UbiE